MQRPGDSPYRSGPTDVGLHDSSRYNHWASPSWAVHALCTNGALIPRPRGRQSLLSTIRTVASTFIPPGGIVITIIAHPDRLNPTGHRMNQIMISCHNSPPILPLRPKLMDWIGLGHQSLRLSLESSFLGIPDGNHSIVGSNHN